MSPTTTSEANPSESELAERNRSRIAAAPPRRVSPWTRRQRVIRVVWQTAGRIVWKLVPAGRSTLLRCFGATVGQGCHFAGHIDIVIPWNLTIGDDVTVDDHAILYALGPIEIGRGSRLDVRSHLCAGSHDINDPRFPQIRPAITIGPESSIGIDAFIAPGVTLGARCRVHPRASVYRDASDDTELAGNPAHAVTAEERSDGR